ncbi:MAG TPA: EAL domain-containing protein [Bacilli bacterium]
MPKVPIFKKTRMQELLIKYFPVVIALFGFFSALSNMLSAVAGNLLGLMLVGSYGVLIILSMYSQKYSVKYVASGLAFLAFLLTVPYLEFSHLNVVIFNMILLYAFLLPNPYILSILMSGIYIYLFATFKGPVEEGLIAGNIFGVSITTVMYLFLVYFIKQISLNNVQLSKALVEVEYIAYHDSLTGLPNRYMLRNDLQRTLERSEHENKRFAVMFMDIDRFKMVNDTMGHDIGDLLLQKVTDRLSDCVRTLGVLARQGGDEFIFLLEEGDRKEAGKVAELISETCKQPFLLFKEEVYISYSIGISLYPDHGEDVETLLKNADAAMYSAKEHGKNNYQFYSDDYGVTSRKMQLEQGLRRAISHNELHLYYQPQIDLRTDRINGIEALLRWNHPELGAISPAEFITIAEETGSIIPIGLWVLRTACRQNKVWQTKGMPPLRIAVNISAKQFKGIEDQFVRLVQSVLKETNLEPQYLELELTETVMQNSPEAILMLRRLKSIGVKITIDDFGTGYSSLSVLNQLPIDYLKIDQSFIMDLFKNSNTASIVKTIIDLGDNLKFQLVAEGVETEEQKSFLQLHQCQSAQGYLYSPPVPADEFQKLWKTYI